jgi:hypothetical protein
MGAPTPEKRNIAWPTDICVVSLPDVTHRQVIAPYLEERIKKTYYRHESNKLTTVYCI